MAPTKQKQKEITRKKRYAARKVKKQEYRKKAMEEKQFGTAAAGAAASTDEVPSSTDEAPASIGKAQTTTRRGLSAKEAKSVISLGYENRLLKRKVAALEKMVAKLMKENEELRAFKEKTESVVPSVVEQIAHLNGAMAYLLGDPAHNGQYYHKRSEGWFQWKHDAWGGESL